MTFQATRFLRLGCVSILLQFPESQDRLRSLRIQFKQTDVNAVATITNNCPHSLPYSLHDVAVIDSPLQQLH